MDEIKRIKNLKRLFLSKAYANGASHLPSGLSSLEILYVLYNKIAKITRQNAAAPHRDRVIISKEHSRWAQACVLVEAGLMDADVLDTFLKKNGELGHDMYNIVGSPKIAAVDYASGSLGHGLGVGCGYAWDRQHQVYVIVGDGELQEGSCWEALLFIAQHNLRNLTVVIDANEAQIDDATRNIIDTTRLAPKAVEALGFHVIDVNGHDICELERAFRETCDRPKCIVAHTIKGKELLFVRERVGYARFHWLPLAKEDWEVVEKEFAHD